MASDEIRWKDVPNERFEFESDDFVVVDGATGGSGKMKASKLLELTAQNALAGNVAKEFVPNSTTTFANNEYVYNGSTYTAKVDGYKGPWDASMFVKKSVNKVLSDALRGVAPKTGEIIDIGLQTESGYLSKSNGEIVLGFDYSVTTEYVDLWSYLNSCFFINSIAGYSACIYAVYDSNKNFIESYGKSDNGYVIWNEKKIYVADILLEHDDARYIRFGAWPDAQQGAPKFFVGIWNQDTIDSVHEELLEKISNTSKDSYLLRLKSLPDSGFTENLNLQYESGSYINKDSGTFMSVSDSERTDFIDITNFVGKTFEITASAGYSACIYAVYDENKKFLNSYGKNPPSGQNYVVWDKRRVLSSEIFSENPNAKYIAFSSWPASDVSLVVNLYENDSVQNAINELNGKINNIYPSSGKIDDAGFEKIVGGYINKSSGLLNELESAKYTDFIELRDKLYDIFYVTAVAGYNTCICAIYDSNKNFIESYGKSDNGLINWNKEQLRVRDIIESHDDAVYIRFSSWPITTSDLVIEKFVPYSIDELFEKSKENNVLYGKKWVACGDSYTQAANLSSAGYDPQMDIYKSYAWWIAQRTGCDLVMKAVGGQRIHNDPNSTNKFTPDEYKTIPLDADIITLSWGLNEINVALGDSSSSDDTTLWGAFNEVISWILTNIPSCKIGIIISDGWMTERIANAEKEIGAFWGIPVLDLKYDVNIPLGISSSAFDVPQPRPNTSILAQEKRNEAFRDETNHPNAAAHEYRSTFIENWLKSL
jgi:hypothetical protein